VSICGPKCLGRPWTSLKLETQPEWFEGLVARLGLDRGGLFGRAWRAFAGQDAFYLAHAGPTIDHVHPTNASGRLAEFYTEASAAVVAETYADDFDVFGYCRGFECIRNGTLS